MSATAQCLMFEINKWSIQSAIDWLQARGYNYRDLRVTETSYYFCQYKQKKSEHYETYKHGSDHSIKCVVGFPNDNYDDLLIF